MELDEGTVDVVAPYGVPEGIEVGMADGNTDEVDTEGMVGDKVAAGDTRIRDVVDEVVEALIVGPDLDSPVQTVGTEP